LDIIGNLNVSNFLTSANIYTTNITSNGLKVTDITSNNILTTNITSSTINVISYINVSSGSWETTGDDIIISANNSSINLRPTRGSSANSIIINNSETVIKNNNNVNSFVLNTLDDSVTLTGRISVMSSVNSVGLGSGGSLTVLGGSSIKKDAYIGGKLNVYSTEASTGYTNGSVILSGGLTITGNNSSFDSGNGGDLTVQGGGAFGGDLYIGGSINGSNTSTFSYLTITATDDAINITSGSLVTFGGITIQTTANSSSVTNGGGLLVGGGVSVIKDVYIGGDQYNYGMFNIRSDVNNILNFYDVLDIKGFSIDYNNSTRNFSISRYDTNSTLIEKSIDINNGNGIIRLSNTTPSTALNSAALIIEGGISVNSTKNASSLANGGSASILGGTSISKDLLVGGTVRIYSTTASNDSSTGSLVVDGGTAIKGNLNVLGNTVINGNLTVSGSTTNVESTNTTLTDNILVLNSGPAGSKDSGFTINRYQFDNDTGVGDVVNDQLYIGDTLPLQGGVNSTEVKLSNSASASDNYYTGWWIKVVSGFNNNQVRKILAYNGTTKVATISSVWTTQNPTNGDNVYLYNKPYVGIIYNELNDRFELGGSVDAAATSGSLTFTSNIPLYVSEITMNSTKNANNVSSGSIISNGGILLLSTANSSSLTDGGSLLSLGGASISKDLIVGGGLNVSGIAVSYTHLTLPTSP
jgi:hypothetical protein